MVQDEVPDYLARMVRRIPPRGAPVVPGSTPVVAFGDPAKAQVATLGINPSRVEFVTDGKLLAGDERRLATLESLDAQAPDALTDAQVATLVRECGRYFHQNPYMAWFNKLEAVLRAIGFSYFDGTACHLDLIQWATDPVWGRLPDEGVKAALLADGVPHLTAQLESSAIRNVFVNGAAVLDQISSVGLAAFEKVGTISTSTQTFGLYVGNGGGRRWFGWSANLQSSAGIGGEFLDELSSWLAGELREGTAPPLSSRHVLLDADGSLPRGVSVTGKQALVELLATWLERTDAPTVGDIGSFGGKPWIHAQIGDRQVVVNADTTRAAVQQVVTAWRDGARDWRVVENANGRVNKLLPWPDRKPLPGWYAYVTEALAESTHV